MIIKSMPRKSVSFGQLLSYLHPPEADRSSEAGKSSNAGRHDLEKRLQQNFSPTASGLQQVQQEFQRNAHLLRPRKNGNILYHEVLSLSPEDAPVASRASLLHLAHHYLQLRAPHALAYGTVHTDTANPHIHLVISANNAGERERIRLSRKQFRTVKNQLEQYQREQYPQLSHSLVQSIGKSKGHQPQSSSESERQRQLEKANLPLQPSAKERLRKLVRRTITTSSSGEELYRQLKTLGLTLFRRGKTIGLREKASGRKYRLTTLGLAEEMNRALESWRRTRQRNRAPPRRTIELQR